MDVELDDCDWELKCSRLDGGVSPDLDKFDLVTGVGVSQSREQK